MKTNKLLLLALALVFVIAFAACNVDEVVNSNAINGLVDITLTCGESLPQIDAKAEFGEITLGIAKAVDGTPKENLNYQAISSDALNEGTYYIKAYVAAAETYKEAAAYATVTVSHQAFDKIEGDGTTKSETTTDGKYRTWTEKQCACGATVIGNEQVTDKQPNAISGLADLTLTCGAQIPDLSGVTAAHGTVTLEIATAVEGTDKEQLTYAAIATDLKATHGVYYVRATVAEGDDYLAATAYAKVTVNHVAYADIEGDATHVAAEGTTKGYDYKLCACQQQVKGDTEYVWVIVKVDGTAVFDAEVAIGDEVTIDDFSDKLTSRTDYGRALLQNGEEWLGVEVTDFATIELNYHWALFENAFFDKVTGDWRFTTEGTAYTEDTVSTLTYDEESKIWKVNTYFDSNNPYSPAQITLSDIQLKEGYSYTFAIGTDKDTYVNFGTGTWDDYAYLVKAEEVVYVTVIYDGNATTVWYNDTSRTYTNAQWSTHNLNGLTLAIQDKDLDNLGKRYNVVLNGVVVVTYDYRLHEEQLVAQLPEAENVDENSADNVMAVINKIKAIRETHFTEFEKANATDITAVTEAAQTIINNHSVQLNKLLKDLPDFDTMWTASQDEQDAAFTALTKYLAYYNVKFTDDEKANYTEPKQISFYREFFKDRTVVTDNAFAQSSAPFNSWSDHKTTHWNPNNQSGYVTLPQIAYGAFDKVQFNVQAAGENIVMKYNDQAVTSGDWHEFIIAKKDDGWYASFDWTDKPEAERTWFKLSDDIVLGNESIQFFFSNGGWGWLCIGINDNPTKLNHIFGTLTAGDVTVHSVQATYKNAVGADVVETKYYLDGEQLVLPECESTYVSNYGTHTFTGWFVGDVEHTAGETVNDSIELVAVYQINEGDWRNYTVKYYGDDNEQYGDVQSYHYTDSLVLPIAPTKAEDDQYAYVFIGWFDDADKQWNEGDQVTSNLELVAKFEAQDKTRTQYVVTLKNLEGDDQTVTVYEDDTATLPKVAREGYVFDCWLLDGEKYDENALVTSDLTLVAKWLVKATGEKETVFAASYLSDNVTGSLNDGRTPAYDKADDWWTDNDGTKLDQWFLVGNNKDKSLLTFELPVINLENYSKLTFNLLINSGFNASISIVPDGSESPTDLAANSQGGCVKMVIAQVNGVWTIAAHTEDGKVQSAAIPTSVVVGEEKLTLRFWTNADWTTNDNGELVDGPWVYMSEIKGFAKGNVDYVAKAAEAATAIDNLADGAEDATKLAALKKYTYWRLCFTAYEQENNAEAESVVALKAHLNGLGNQTIVANCYNEIETTMPDWTGNDNKYNPNNGSYSVSLPKIMYGMYESITMVMKCNSENATFTASYGNASLDVTMSNAAGWLMFTVSKQDDCYYMKVWDANGSAYFEVKLSDEIVRGDQAFTFTLATNAWSWCWLGTTSADNCVTATVAK